MPADDAARAHHAEQQRDGGGDARGRGDLHVQQPARAVPPAAAAAEGVVAAQLAWGGLLEALPVELDQPVGLIAQGERDDGDEDEQHLARGGEGR